jgi:hypothetical protein
VLPIKKLTMGLAFASPQFRVDSNVGDLVDIILAARGSKSLPKDYFDQISESPGQKAVHLMGSKTNATLWMDRNNFQLTVSTYDRKEQVNIDDSINIYLAVLTVVQKYLKIPAFSRFGIVAEHRIDNVEHASATLLNQLTKLPAKEITANVHFHFETRHNVAEGVVNKDALSSDYRNSLIDYYDSGMDAQHPEQNKINVNYDYQRYFNPFLEKNVEDAIRQHANLFKKRLLELKEQTVALGLLNER